MKGHYIPSLLGITAEEKQEGRDLPRDREVHDDWLGK